jgi:hypothetical protein
MPSAAAALNSISINQVAEYNGQRSGSEDPKKQTNVEKTAA